MEIVLWLIPEIFVSVWLAGGPEMAADNSHVEKLLKWRSGEYILHYFIIHVGLWPVNALAA